MTIILPIMLALCSMLLGTYYAQNYAGIIRGVARLLVMPGPSCNLKTKQLLPTDNLWGIQDFLGGVRFQVECLGGRPRCFPLDHV